MDETTALVPLATSPAESEAYQMLLARAHRKTGAIPPELVVRHVLTVTAGAGSAAQREALPAERPGGAGRPAPG